MNNEGALQNRAELLDKIRDLKRAVSPEQQVARDYILELETLFADRHGLVWLSLANRLVEARQHGDEELAKRLFDASEVIRELWPEDVSRIKSLVASAPNLATTKTDR